MSVYNDIEQSLLEAIELEKSDAVMKKKNNIPAATYYVDQKDWALIDELVQIRKAQNISQAELAEMTENSQQSISRFEKKAHSPSLKFFVNLADILGYNVVLAKKSDSNRNED